MSDLLPDADGIELSQGQPVIHQFYQTVIGHTETRIVSCLLIRARFAILSNLEQSGGPSAA